MMITKEIRMAVVLIVALAVVLVSISGARADDTGWKDPSANAADTGGGGDGFEVNPTGAYTNDTNFASNMNGAYDCHSYYNYNFGIPTGTTIDGIEVRLDWWLDNTEGTNRMFAKLSWNGGFDLTSPKMADTEGISDGDPTDIVGGPTDTWGRSWSLDEFSDDNFRVWLTCESDYDTRDFYLDWVPVKVYYSFPDLIITDKREIWNGCNFTVSYKVKNQGNGTAGESNATLYVDDIPVENQTTPALGPGWSTGELTFDYVVSCPCGETRTIKVCADNDTVVAESDETNNCVEQSVVPEPDLIIVDKHENWIDNNNFNVSYKVKNQGPCPAGLSFAMLYVNGVEKKYQDTPVLGPGDSTDELTFDCVVACPCDGIVNITVCADDGGSIGESDETNNCAVNFVDRDLVITDIWIDDSKIYYEIENRGNVKAPRSYSSLYVDGVFKRIDSVNELAPGKSSIESFWGYSWTCTSPEDTIEVCADYDKRINESKETNNCRTEIGICPTPTPTPTPTCPDLVITDVWNVGSTIYYEIENIGGVAAPVSYSRLYIDGRSKRSDNVKTLGPGESSIESFSYRWSCTSSSDTIKVCADHTKRIAECDESNNCLTETWPC